ncbi:hypothetical protein [Mycobacterium sp.]|uniref:hypothetical protein n=1 Tax=Mycobacterium sp. TaxID=1785 RepID=UPI0025D6B102|nr:hypothetical protein [Mycobacterium sp.]
MSEQVIRHRGGGRDDNSQIIPASSTPLTAIGVALGIVPGVRPRQRISSGRDGEDTAAIVYFAPGTDLVNSDELTVRGKRYRIIVNDWQMQGRGGLEVLCARGQG